MDGKIVDFFVDEPTAIGKLSKVFEEDRTNELGIIDAYDGFVKEANAV